MENTVTVTDDLINAARSPKGGWTRETLALLGVPWPPPKGWRRRLLGTKVSRRLADKLLGVKPAPESPPLTNLERLYRENESMAADGR